MNPEKGELRLGREDGSSSSAAGSERSISWSELDLDKERFMVGVGASPNPEANGLPMLDSIGPMGEDSAAKVPPSVPPGVSIIPKLPKFPRAGDRNMGDFCQKRNDDKSEIGRTDKRALQNFGNINFMTTLVVVPLFDSLEEIERVIFEAFFRASPLLWQQQPIHHLRP